MSMKLAIIGMMFDKAYMALEHYSKCVDEVVEEELRGCKSREAYEELLKKLPKGYEGSRRVRDKMDEEFPDLSCDMDDCSDCVEGKCTSKPLFDCPE